MSNIRSRLIMVGVVVGVGLLSVGATAYAAEQEQRLATATAAATEAAPTARATPSATPSAAPPTEPAPVVATPTAAAPADETTPSDGASGDGTSGDGTSGDGAGVEVRTPDPEAVPTTVAERQHFYGFVTQCMAEAGFDWQAVVSENVVSESDGAFTGVDFTHVGDVDPALQAGFTLALYGDTGAGDYHDWAEAGCWGYAVHVTGNDGNN